MKLGAETIAHLQIAEWIRQCTNLPFFHFAGERKCTAAFGAILKRMGTRAGVSDFYFPRSSANFKGLWLELKVGKNKPTPAQLSFIADIIAEGYAAQVVYGFDEAVLVIKSFYGLQSTESTLQYQLSQYERQPPDFPSTL